MSENTANNIIHSLSKLFRRLLHNLHPSDDRLADYAHEIRHYLLLNQELIHQAQEINDNNELAKTINRMQVALTRTIHHTNCVLLADKQHSNTLNIHPIKLDLNKLLEEILMEFEPLLKAANMTSETNFAHELPKVSIDPAIFPSAIHNLLDNTIKYSKTGETISISTKHLNNHLVSLEISDNGIGIPVNEKHRIFSKRYRANNTDNIHGNGLGLHISKTIIEAHNGKIALVDNPNFSTTFEIRLTQTRRIRKN